MIHPKYRPDIDGLRALAVGAVVIYHAAPAAAPGGFVGVDIFFVISGYLISTILYENLEAGRFSLVDFYFRRALRILPALVVVLFASFLVAYRWLLADEMDAFGRSLLAGSAFVANIEFLRDSNYFSGLAILKPLLHLWSLSVEEQFYLVWPLLLAAAWRARVSPLVAAAAIALLSFAWSVREADTAPIAAFFSAQSRAWELMTGAMLAYFVFRNGAVEDADRRRWAVFADAGSVLGVALMIYAVYWTRAEGFPGFGAVAPVLGATLAIACGPRALANRIVFAHPAMVGLGLISYPLYLWHWPLLSFARIIEAGPTSLSTRLCCVAAALALAWATYLFVERPIRFGARTRLKPLALVASLCVAIALGAAAEGGAFDGAGLRTPDRAEFARYFDNSYPFWRYRTRVDLAAKFRLDCDFYDPGYISGAATLAPRARIDPSCYQRDPGKAKVAFIWGDSHAQMLFSGLRAVLGDDWQILIVASSACAPDASVRADSDARYCLRSNWFAMRAIATAKPDVVIIARVDGHRYADLAAVGAAVTAAGARSVLFTGPVPQWDAPFPALVQRRLWDAMPERTRLGLDAFVMAENARLKSDFERAGDDRLVDLVGLFCNDSGCLTRVGPDPMRDLVTFDYGHLTPPASLFLAREALARRVEEAAGETPGDPRAPRITETWRGGRLPAL
jgi:peptidoglycan/LPS O-acetylase OafA/YrhL